MGRRILVTGLGTFWGGKVAKALEADPTVDIIVGLDTKPPSVELERTEFVRVDENYSILARLVKAARRAGGTRLPMRATNRLAGW